MKHTILTEVPAFVSAETVWDELFARADALTELVDRRGEDERVARRLQSELRVKDSYLDYGEDDESEITKAETPASIRRTQRVLPSMFANDDDIATKPGIPAEVFEHYRMTA
jgi:hypothetical protein